MNWVRIRCAFSALVLVLMAGAARGGVLYWMIADDASESFQYAYAQTLQKAKDTVQGANADSVVARAYAVDKSTGTRETYDFVGVVAADDAGTSFDGAPVPVELPSTAASGNWIFGVEMGFMDGNDTFTVTYCAWDAKGLTYAQLDAMGAIQSNATASYDRPINVAVAGGTWSEPTPVPEPTGGLLVVLGGAVLLLRRNGHA